MRLSSFRTDKLSLFLLSVCLVRTQVCVRDCVCACTINISGCAPGLSAGLLRGLKINPFLVVQLHNSRFILLVLIISSIGGLVWVFPPAG